jgi:predicted AAA+ superfamily ATPase
VLHELRAAISYRNRGGDIYHWRTSGGSEIDFIWQRGENAIGIEVKNSPTWRSDFGKALRPLLNDKKLSRGLVIYRGKHPTLDQGVEGLPLEIFLSRLWSGDVIG